MTTVLFLFFSWGTVTGQITSPPPTTLTLNVPESAPDAVKILLDGTTLRYPNRKLTPQEWGDAAKRLQAILDAYAKQECPTCDSTDLRKRDETIARLRDSLRICLEGQVREKLMPIASIAPPDTCVPKKFAPITEGNTIVTGTGWSKRTKSTWSERNNFFEIGGKRTVKPTLLNLRGARNLNWWAQATGNFLLTISSLEENGIKGMKAGQFFQSLSVEGGATLPFKILDDGQTRLHAVTQGGLDMMWDPTLEKIGFGPMLGATAFLEFGSDGCGNSIFNNRFTASLRGSPFGIANYFKTLHFEMSFTNGRTCLGFFVKEASFSRFSTSASSVDQSGNKSLDSWGLRLTYTFPNHTF